MGAIAGLEPGNLIISPGYVFCVFSLLGAGCFLVISPSLEGVGQPYPHLTKEELEAPEEMRWGRDTVVCFVWCQGQVQKLLVAVLARPLHVGSRGLLPPAVHPFTLPPHGLLQLSDNLLGCLSRNPPFLANKMFNPCPGPGRGRPGALCQTLPCPGLGKKVAKWPPGISGSRCGCPMVTKNYCVAAAGPADVP